MICTRCGSVESNETSLLRAMGDFEILFGDIPMTRSALLYFIDYQVSKTTVYRIMKKHCEFIAQGKKSEYKLKSKNVEELINQIRENQRYKDKCIGIRI